MNFNPAQWHLLVNHMPIIGSIIILFLLAYGILSKSKSVIKAAYWLIVLVAIFTFVASQTGDKAEHFLLDAKLADEDIIERHEEAAGIAQWAMIGIGIASLAALFINRLKTSAAMPVIILILSLIVAGLMAWAGLLGGEIMHKEIRKDSAVTVQSLNILLSR